MIEMNDLLRQHKRIEGEIDRAIRGVFSHGKFILGPEVFALEERLAEYVGIGHAVSCASGTDAILMAMMAWGVGPGDAVFTPTFTFVAAAEAARLLGATPVFVEIDKGSFLMDAGAFERAAQKILREGKLRPRVVVPADLFGAIPDYDAIEGIADRLGVRVLEDAAQSFGARRRGRRAGRFGDAAITSFFPSKPLGCYGDGGAVFTDDADFAEALRSIRLHGRGRDKYDNVRVGLNARLDTIQAAILLAKLDIFDDELDLREKIARRYADALGGAVTPQRIPPDCDSNWSQFSVLANDPAHREGARQRLKSHGVATAVYYPKPLHLQAAFADLGYRAGNLPAAEDVSSRIFSLPMCPYLAEGEIDEVIRGILG